MWSLVSNNKQAHSAKRGGHHPAPTITGGHDSGNRVWQWSEEDEVQAVKNMGIGMLERHGERPGRDISQPAFTVRASAGGVEPGGFRWKEQDMSDAIRVTPEEAATLQSYPAGFEFKGAKGKRYMQIGNAVPPLLARVVLEALWGSADELELAA